jgi:uncharacterized protein DUF222/HNH endonuclease
MDDRAVAMMSGEELLSASDVIEEAIENLMARRTEIVQRMDDIKYAQEVGAHDTARLLATRYRLDPAEARRRVRLAAALPKYPAVAAALPTPGNSIADDAVLLSSAQAAAIVSALEKLPKSVNVPVEELDAAAAQMVLAARHMNPGELRRLGVQVRNILDTDGPEPREEAARAREEVWVKKADDGVKFGGYLAGENAEKLQTVLQAGAKPHKTADGEQDPRSRGKRQADALVDALDIALASGDLPTRGGIKPHIAVTIDLNDLIAAGRQATGDLTYGDGLSASAIRRLACDAGIIPIVLGSDSQPLDVGREFRYVTNGLRNALNQRDKGCVVCHAPPIYCDAHHLVSWFDGGVTSLANLVLLCRVDHTSLHDGHWTITIVDNQVQVTRPSWADPPPRSTGRRLDLPSTTSATAPAPMATEPWPPPTETERPPSTTGDDPWAARTAEDTDPAATAASTETKSATVPARPAPPALAPGAVEATRSNWPYNGDAPWITAEEAAALDPWGDKSAGAPTSAMPESTREPIGGRSRAGGAPWATPAEAVALDPWGDEPSGVVMAGGVPGRAVTPTGGPVRIDEDQWATPEEAAGFDSWADSA